MLPSTFALQRSSSCLPHRSELLAGNSRAASPKVCTHRAIDSSTTCRFVRVHSAVTPVHTCELFYQRSAHSRASRAVGNRAASESKESPVDEEEDENPHTVLRVSPGTTFLGLLAGRREARVQAGDDEVQLAKVERAFRTFVDSSEKRFKDELEKDPSNPVAIYNFANFLQTIEDFDQAEEVYRTAMAADPNNVDTINNLALLLQEQRGDFEGADKLYAQAAELDPNNVDVLFNWALLKKDALDDLEGGSALVDKVLQLRPTLAEHPLIEEFQRSKANSEDPWRIPKISGK